ncbi:hypothetical protein ADS46_06860 [Halomonas sp. G11]|nr:hypothetical protein ADS46_06860 [Halomonas sp. G11]
MLHNQAGYQNLHFALVLPPVMAGVNQNSRNVSFRPISVYIGDVYLTDAAIPFRAEYCLLVRKNVFRFTLVGKTGGRLLLLL